MSDFRKALDAAFASAVEQAEGLSATYEQELADARADMLLVLDDLALGKITTADAELAAKRSFETLRSLLLAGALDTRTAAADAALKVVAAVLKVALGAVV